MRLGREPQLLCIDLTKFFNAEELGAHCPEVLRNNTVDGKLVSVRTSVDVGLLCYRTDLLTKYGFSHPPDTWDELTEWLERLKPGKRPPATLIFTAIYGKGRDESEGVNYPRGGLPGFYQ